MNQIDPIFANEQLDLRGLPEADKLVMIPLEPAYKTARYISAGAMGLLMILSGWTLAITQTAWGYIGYLGAGLLTLISIWLVVYTGISFTYMGYALREKHISFTSGWLWKRMTTIPFNRVQHCDIRQTLLDRKFGLSKLTIYTAGGQNTDLMIPGLLPETAERLKSFILRSTEQSLENE